MRHPLGRGRVFLIVPIALICLALPLPFGLLFLDDDAATIDDTRAWFGAGTSQGVPAVSGHLFQAAARLGLEPRHRLQRLELHPVSRSAPDTGGAGSLGGHDLRTGHGGE
jgi:hypothetical protein